MADLLQFKKGTAEAFNKLTKAASTVYFAESGDNCYLYLGAKNIIPALLDTSHGGTGSSVQTKNRLSHTDGTGKIVSSTHFASNTQVAINSDKQPTTTFYVKGTAGISGDVTVGPNFSICNSSGGNTALIFNRNTNANWQILNASGILHFQCDYASSKGDYYDVLTLSYKTKKATFFGDILPGTTQTQALGSSANKWKALYVGDSTNATSTTSGAVQVTGGIAVTKNGYFGEKITAKTMEAKLSMSILGNDDSTSKSTGALKVSGGIGVTGNINAASLRLEEKIKFSYNSTDDCFELTFE